jgi:hypothetical protein
VQQGERSTDLPSVLSLSLSALHSSLCLASLIHFSPPHPPRPHTTPSHNSHLLISHIMAAPVASVAPTQRPFHTVQQNVRTFLGLPRSPQTHTQTPSPPTSPPRPLSAHSHTVARISRPVSRAGGSRPTSRASSPGGHLSRPGTGYSEVRAPAPAPLGSELTAEPGLEWSRHDRESGGSPNPRRDAGAHGALGRGPPSLGVVVLVGGGRFRGPRALHICAHAPRAPVSGHGDRESAAHAGKRHSRNRESSA